MKPLTKPCVWITGLSGAGKSHLARALARRVEGYVLDADDLRMGINADLGFSAADRSENVRRMAHVARIMASAGVLPVVACCSPRWRDRDAARWLFPEGRFIEVYVDTPLAVCMERDSKGLYREYRAGRIQCMIGLDIPYELTPHPGPDVVVRHGETERGLTEILGKLEAM